MGILKEYNDPDGWLGILGVLGIGLILGFAVGLLVGLSRIGVY